LFDGVTCRDKNGEEKRYFVTELLPNGDLSKVAKAEEDEDTKGEKGKQVEKKEPPKRMGLHAKVRLIKQSLEALAYVHKKGILHRDIKPENIMLDKDMNAKVIDFGEARKADPSGRVVDPGRSGTPGYRPKELEEPAPAYVFDMSTDIYAFKITA